jgi:hypothetical protein
MLPYEPNQAYTDYTRTQFVADYFNPGVITPAMRDLGQEFLKRFTISGQPLTPNTTNIMTYLTEGSLQIGVPAVAPGWNSVNVSRPVGDNNADHSVELYKYDPSGAAFPYYIYDSYEPHLKQLSKDYPIVLLNRVYIWPIAVTQAVPLPQFSPWMKFWFAVKALLSGQPNPFPDVQVGSLRWFNRS